MKNKQTRARIKKVRGKELLPGLGVLQARRLRHVGEDAAGDEGVVARLVEPGGGSIALVALREDLRAESPDRLSKT